VVIATGHCDVPATPKVAAAVDPRATSLHSAHYASPSVLPPGGVLVVGASASGVQIADELRMSGRDVTIAVGTHTRLPRTWRGSDIHRLLHRTGMLVQRTLDLPNPAAAWKEPAPQLAGRPDRAEVDLASLQARGVRLAGRLVSASGGRVAFADDLAASVGEAEAKQRRVLAQIDALSGIDPAAAAQALPSVDLTRSAPLHLDLRGEGITTVIWATGYRRGFGWLDLPIHAAGGELAHRDGVASVPGIYALGFRLLRKRDSHFIGGVGSDASFISDHICGFLGQRGRRAA
jgi:putative flavoprotein involved in K+ transport